MTKPTESRWKKIMLFNGFQDEKLKKKNGEIPINKMHFSSLKDPNNVSNFWEISIIIAASVVYDVLTKQNRRTNSEL